MESVPSTTACNEPSVPLFDGCFAAVFVTFELREKKRDHFVVGLNPPRREFGENSAAVKRRDRSGLTGDAAADVAIHSVDYSVVNISKAFSCRFVRSAIKHRSFLPPPAQYEVRVLPRCCRSSVTSVHCGQRNTTV